ncbi:phosphatase PAP2 family protein [Erythrobacteraceae bacterium CFH 75059]|uniref:phosphatase PAP2 family protein n=1 Tax=Qipengyuania thermophila TaxID=2509361 RepID=UPI00101FF115|nr:phosphatase PAP2 family protein [Qipengyuania thermophila]TCD04793.1 phosphatase PAP2 family protein [Erythrobacteraceae bacterium CFH 75059]
MNTPDAMVPPATEDANAVEQLDVAIAQKAGEYRRTPVIRVLGTMSEVADQPPLIAICAATLAAGLATGRPKLARTGARMLAAHLLATGMKAVIKKSVDRTRPHLLVEENRYESGKGQRNEGPYNSFPSGHTAGAVAVARAVAHEYPAAAPAAGALATAIALVQIPRCAHYVSDITAGAIIGWIAEATVTRGFARWFPD